MKNNKQNFTEQLFLHLAELDYVTLKHLDGKLENEQSDLDLLVKAEDTDSILEFIQTHPDVVKLLTYAKKSMVQAFIFFKDDSFLQLDLLFKLVRKQYEYLVSSELLKRKKKRQLGSIPTPMHC